MVYLSWRSWSGGVGIVLGAWLSGYFYTIFLNGFFNFRTFSFKIMILGIACLFGLNKGSDRHGGDGIYIVSG